MKYLKLIICTILCTACLLSTAPVASAAGYGTYSVKLAVDGKEVGTVKAIEAEEAGNTYISMRSMSAVLNGTDARFSMDCMEKLDDEGNTYKEFYIESGKNFKPDPLAEDVTSVTLGESLNKLFFNGEERKYYTFRAGRDIFMNITDIQLMFNFTAEYTESGVLNICPGTGFAPDIDDLRAADYFSFCNGIVVGDADTGKILFSNNRLRQAPVASLTKLMTYLLVMEAADSGRISLEDKAVVSGRAAAISHNAATMTIWLTEGIEIPVTELLQAMLIASSNESAVVLAEHVSGSVETFVERMNSRAEELGLRYARFYNPNGLPMYSPGTVNTKIQNMMSAMDMFTLSAYILNKYPGITEITSLEKCEFPTMDSSWDNTNAVLYNMDGVTGLKTGYTNKSGYCMVVSLPVTCKGETHNILAVVLGTETSPQRNRMTEILLRYAEGFYEANGF